MLTCRSSGGVAKQKKKKKNKKKKVPVDVWYFGKYMKMERFGTAEE